MSEPYAVVKQFEDALCEYTGAKYAVTTNSCTSALMLAVAWHLHQLPKRRVRAYFGAVLPFNPSNPQSCPEEERELPHLVEIPKRTYVSVPMSIIHAGGRPTFRDEDWEGAYQLKPLPVWDSARRFTGGMFRGMEGTATMLCVSFHASKILGDTQGGAILHDNAEADAWLRRARFDGRTEGIAPKDDTFTQIGWHVYMSNDVAARLLLKLSSLWPHMADLPNDDYPDLSTFDIFK